MPTLELIAEIQFLKTQLTQCQERLAEAEGCLPILKECADECLGSGGMDAGHKSYKELAEAIQKAKAFLEGL